MDLILLKPEEAAELLRLSRSKVYEMAAAGVLPSVRMGGAVRIPASELRRWVEQHTSVPGDSAPAAAIRMEDAQVGLIASAIDHPSKWIVSAT